MSEEVPSTSEAPVKTNDGDRYVLFDTAAKKIKPGAKSRAPQNLIKRAGGLKNKDLK